MCLINFIVLISTVVLYIAQNRALKTAILKINSFIIEFIFVARFNLHMWGLQKFDFGKEFSIYFTWINTQEYFVWTRKRCNTFLGNSLLDLLIILQTWGLKCMNIKMHTHCLSNLKFQHKKQFKYWVKDNEKSILYLSFYNSL